MIALYGSNGNSKQYEIFKGSLKPDAKHVRDIDVDINVGKIQKVTFLWKKHWLNISWYKLGASNTAAPEAIPLAPRAHQHPVSSLHK